MTAVIPTLEQLVLKGTHNSYDQRRKVTVAHQVEHYGAWAVELDYAVLWAERRAEITASYGRHDAWFSLPPPCVIGHDGPGVCADDAGPVFSGGPDYLLRDVLAALAATEASAFRPLIIYLDKKEWLAGLIRVDDPAYDDPAALSELVAGELNAVFGSRLFTHGELRAFRVAHDRFPTAVELAGRVMAIATTGPGGAFLFHEGSPANLDDPGLLVEGPVDEGCGRPAALPRIPSPPPQVWRTDNFSSRWTWDYAAPPNPLAVARTAPTADIVGCSEDPDIIAREPAVAHGTRLVPYPSIAAAAARAGGLLSSGGRGGPAQSGLGFTVLAAPGAYREAMRIDFPLTIRARPPDQP
jgi:hypothetical protein